MHCTIHALLGFSTASLLSRGASTATALTVTARAALTARPDAAGEAPMVTAGATDLLEARSTPGSNIVPFPGPLASPATGSGMPISVRS